MSSASLHGICCEGALDLANGMAFLLVFSRLGRVVGFRCVEKHTEPSNNKLNIFVGWAVPTKKLTVGTAHPTGMRFVQVIIARVLRNIPRQGGDYKDKYRES